MSGYSGIILAGGDGPRLTSLTRRLAGDARPKQFCRLIGDDTLMEQTRRRARMEPAEPILDRCPWPIYRVRRFWEKPSLPVAERLRAAGCLWNCVVVVARPWTLQQLIRRATPELYEAFAPLRTRLGTPWEEETARAVYRRLPSTDLSRHVFQTCAESLAVLPVSGVGWTDLGDPARVHEAQARLGWQPATA